jgi:hypothetical protein
MGFPWLHWIPLMMIQRHLMMMNFLYQRRRTIFVPRLCSPGKRRLDYESHGSRL